MIATYPEFIKESDRALKDESLRGKISAYNSHYKSAVQHTCSQFKDLELARKRAARLRWNIINHLDKYLIEFESNVIKNGGKVIWAQDNNEAVEAISGILLKKEKSRFISRTNSLSRDLSGSPEWTKKNVEVLEADYGHFILHADKDQASHTVIPALHKSTEEIATSLSRHFEIKEKSTEGIASLIRNEMQESLQYCDVAVSGAQFLLADIGGAVLSDDEGTGLYVASFPQCSIIVASIDSMLTGLHDLDLMLPLYSTYSAGEPLRTYNTIVKSPRLAEDLSGNGELYFILIDNGKSELLGREEQRQVLSCINCGACLPASSIYKTIGGKAYPGPAQTVTAPIASKSSEYKYLTDLSTLDGSGSEACPVKINFSRLILHNRKEQVENGEVNRNEKLFYYAWKKAMLKRDIMSWTGINARSRVIDSYFKSKEGLRQMPPRAAKSFNEQWRERMGYK